MLSTFMAAFILYSLKATWIWWIGFILITLLEVLNELNMLERNRLRSQAVMNSIKKEKK